MLSISEFMQFYNSHDLSNSYVFPHWLPKAHNIIMSNKHLLAETKTTLSISFAIKFIYTNSNNNCNNLSITVSLDYHLILPAKLLNPLP